MPPQRQAGKLSSGQLDWPEDERGESGSEWRGWHPTDIGRFWSMPKSGDPPAWDRRRPDLRRYPAVPPWHAALTRRSTKAGVETPATLAGEAAAGGAGDRRSTKARIEAPATKPITANCGQAGATSPQLSHRTAEKTARMHQYGLIAPNGDRIAPSLHAEASQFCSLQRDSRSIFSPSHRIHG